MMGYFKMKQNPKKEINMSNENFPELVSTNFSIHESSTPKKSISYIDKLNLVAEESKEKEDTLLPGWIKIYRDKNNNIKTISNPNSIDSISVEDTIQKRLGPMITRWENYKTEYINLYGEDDYEFNYKFPNYNYNYFDELDELEELEELEQLNELEEKKNNYDMDYSF
jgi:hypothetical protein